MKRLLYVMGVVLAGGLIGWLLFQGASGVEAGDATPVAPAEPRPPEPRASDATSGPVERTAMPSPEPATAPKPSNDGPVVVEPYELAVRVVDDKGAPVPLARVEVWDAQRSPARDLPGRPAQGNTYSHDKAGKEPVLTLATDPGGRCRARIEHEFCLAQASKEGIGDSGLVGLWHSNARKQAEQVLILQALVPLSVLVLHGDGTPAAGASVQVHHSGGTVGANEPEMPDPQTTDQEGRCRFLLAQHQIYGLRAKKKEQWTFTERVSTTANGEPREVTLRFPGAWSIEGRLVDASGRPVTGSVGLWEHMTDEQRRERAKSGDGSPLQQRAKCKGDGSWRVDLPRAGRFDLIGQADGHPTSDLALVEVSSTSPHPSVELRLNAPATIGGSVRHENGEPIAEATVSISAEGEDTRAVGVIGAQDRFGRSRSTKTDAEGKFEFGDAHPRATYRLTCMPDVKRRALRVTQGGIVPGTLDLRIVIKAEQLVAAHIAGTVVSAATGKPVTAFRQWLVRYRDGKVRGLQNEEEVTSATGEFRSEELALGETCALAVASDDYAPALAGPITITKAEHRFDLRLEDLGRVTIRVLEADGTPAAHAEANLQQKNPPVPRSRFFAPRRTDDLGLAVYPKVAPGEYDVFAWRVQGKLEKATTTVRSGQASEVEIKLPR